jgi:hypothetical protein
MPATFTKIATATSTSNNATLSFTAIPNTYSNLVIYAYLRSNRNATNDPISLTFNSTSAGRHHRTDINATGAPTNLSSGTVAWAAAATDSASTASVWGQAVIYIGEYASADAFNRTFVNYGITETASTTSAYLRGTNGGTLDLTVPITSITLTPLSATYWVTSSYAVLYGLE